MSDARGESTVLIDGTEYTMRLTFAQGVKLEQRLTGGISGLILRLIDKQPMTMTEIVDVLHAAAMGGGSKISRDEFGEAVWEHGFSSLLPAAAEVVMTAAAKKGGASEPSEKKE